MHDAAPHYDRTTMALHWTTAILVVALWIMGQTADWLPRGTIVHAYWSLHVLFGFVLTALFVGRIAWRATVGRRLPPSETGILHLLAEAAHYLLYLLIAAVLVLGIANAFVRGYSLFGLIDLPQIGDRALRRPLTGLHGLLSNILMGLAFVHAAAAIGHHYVLRDGVLRRMLPAMRA